MSVEFLPGEVPDDAADELPGGARRCARPVRWIVAALLVGGAVTWAVTRPASAPPRHVAAHPSAAPRPNHDVLLCRGIADCSVHAGVPAGIGRLARTYLPQHAELHVQTVVSVNARTHADQVVRRDIAATAGSVTVVIRVDRGGSHSQAIVPDPPGIGSATIVAMNSGYVVRLQYLAPETVPPIVARLRAFIRDPRLVASS